VKENESSFGHLRILCLLRWSFKNKIIVWQRPNKTAVQLRHHKISKNRETNVKRAEGVSLRVMTTTLYNFWSNKEKN
jgi:hypothetical protein